MPYPIRQTGATSSHSAHYPRYPAKTRPDSGRSFNNKSMNSQRYFGPPDQICNDLNFLFAKGAQTQRQSVTAQNDSATSAPSGAAESCQGCQPEQRAGNSFEQANGILIHFFGQNNLPVRPQGILWSEQGAIQPLPLFLHDWLGSIDDPGVAM
jgi:hypothetical protein